MIPKGIYDTQSTFCLFLFSHTDWTSSCSAVCELSELKVQHLLGLFADVLPGISAQGSTMVDLCLKARRGRKRQNKTAFELKGSSPTGRILRNAEKFHTQEWGHIGFYLPTLQAQLTRNPEGSTLKLHIQKHAIPHHLSHRHTVASQSSVIWIV